MNRLFTAIVLILLASAQSIAMQINASEYEVKSAFLYNFAKFVTWPVGTLNDDDVFVFGVLGDELFVEHLAITLAGKKTEGHKIETKLIQNEDEIAACQILFVAQSYEGSVDALLGRARAIALLTVGDRPQFAHNGGMINLDRNDDSMTIEICTSALERAGLEVSSRLLGLADLVSCRGGD